MAPCVRSPLTICVLCYGAHFNLAQRFLKSLYGNTNPALFSLRAGLNEVEPATLHLLTEYANRFNNIELFIEPKNVFKNPLMRRLFYDKPLTSRWTIWCDDDTHFTRHDWLQRVALKIEHSPEVAMWGWVHLLWRRDREIVKWIRQARWYRGLRLKRGIDLDGNPSAKTLSLSKTLTTELR